MIRLFLKTVVRNFLRDKLISSIGVACLAVGLFCCTFIAYYVDFELSYDKFHTDYERIYTVQGKPVSLADPAAFVSMPMVEEMHKAIPEIESYQRIGRMQVLFESAQNRNYETKAYTVDKDFFEFFGYELIQGDPERVLNSPENLVVTEAVAQKYFGNQNPIGKSIRMESGKVNKEMIVAGVAKNPPANSHFSFDILMSHKADAPNREHIPSPWFVTMHSYIKLKENTTIEAVEAKIPGFKESVMKDTPFYSHGLNLLPVTEIHFEKNVRFALQPSGDIQYVWLFSVVGVVILIMSSLNYINLMVSRFLRRTKVVGIHKVMGAGVSTLARWVILENLLFFVLALVASIVLQEVAQPYLTDLVGTRFELSPFNARVLSVLAAAFIAMAGSISLYPIYILKKIKSAEALKGENLVKTSWFFRKGVSGFQFFISQALVVIFLFIHQQVDFMKNKNLGFQTEQILVVPTNYAQMQGHQAFKSELQKLPFIESVAASDIVPGRNQYHDQIIDVSHIPGHEGEEESWRVMAYTVDADFIKTLDIVLLTGEPISEISGAEGVVINETMQRRLGWDDPVGKKLPRLRGQSELTVVGVMRDFHNRSLRSAVEPAMLLLRDPDSNPAYFIVSLKAGRISEGKQEVASLWNNFMPDKPFESYFLDSDFDAMYLKEETSRQAFNVFTIISILIACGGLFSVASLNLHKRTKEVSIRKVLGASWQRVFVLLSLDFLIPIIVSGLLALPVAYLFMDNWLSGFEFRISLRPAVFLIAFVGLVIFGIGSVAYHTVTTSRVSPVRTLKNK